MSLRKPIFDAAREARRVAGLPRDGGFTIAEVVDFDLALDRLRIPREAPAKPTPAEPDWLITARSWIGTSEIVGPRHNPWIVNKWAQLGAPWFNDDETPWCGLFVAAVLEKRRLSYPSKGLFARALSWSTWGKPANAPLLGAIATFKRDGGGHVGFLVGQSSTELYVLGGNQKNAVNIMPIAKSRLDALRWPSERALGTVIAPQMKGGVISTNER